MRLIALLFIASFGAPTFSCELRGGESIDASDGRTLSYRTEPSAIVVGQHFSIAMQICQSGEPVELDNVRVDARMPAHGHGMNYRPIVTRLAPGRYSATGFLFHMPGQWQFVFEIGSGQMKKRLLIERDV